MSFALRPWHVFVLAPFTGLMWLWMYWVDRLVKTSPREPNSATDQIWPIGPTASPDFYVTRVEYLTYNLSWLGLIAIAVVGLLLVPLYIRIFQPARWRELMRDDLSA